jgi:hypothetical protein
MDKLVVLLQPGVNWIACLSNADLTAFTGDAVYSQCLQSHVFLDQLKKTRDLPWRDANWLMFCQKRNLLTWLNIKPDIRQKGDWVWLVFGLGNPQRRVGGPVTLLVTVVILPENVPQNTNPTWRLPQSQRAPAMYQCGSMVCLLDGWWWEQEFRQKLVWVGLWYTLWPREPPSLL